MRFVKVAAGHRRGIAHGTHKYNRQGRGTKLIEGVLKERSEMIVSERMYERRGSEEGEVPIRSFMAPFLCTKNSVLNNRTYTATVGPSQRSL